MLAVNYSNLRDNLKDYCDKVSDDFETVIVTRKDDKNVVIISLEEYNNLKENLYIMSNPKNYSRLIESKRQLETGNFKEHELIEDESDD